MAKKSLSSAQTWQGNVKVCSKETILFNYCLVNTMLNWLEVVAFNMSDTFAEAT